MTNNSSSSCPPFAKGEDVINKPKVGIYGITGCMGCQLNILYQGDLLKILEVIDLRSFPVGKEYNNEDEEFDIIFLEGVVVSEADLKEVKRLRSITKTLVAIGACATDGCVPAIKNFVDNKNIELSVFQKKELEKMKSLDPMPVDSHVQVDGYIRGCPMDKVEFMQFLKQTLIGKSFKYSEKPVCYECNLRERGCLLEEGVECLGPVTIGNCSVMCPQENYPCVGCRGPYSDSNFEAYFKLLESRGIPKQTIFNHLNRFAGVKFAKMMEDDMVKREKKVEKGSISGMFCCIKCS